MTNLYLAIDNENENITNQNVTEKENQGATHLKSVFCDEPKKCFENAFLKNAFNENQVLHTDNYIMYMCSNKEFDFFKSKLTKTKYKVKR